MTTDQKKDPNFFQISNQNYQKSRQKLGTFSENYDRTLAKTEIIYPKNVGALVAMNFR